MIKFETVLAIFATLVCIIMTAFFWGEIHRPYSVYMDTWITRWFVPGVVMAFGWGTAAMMWFAIAKGRDLFK